MLSLGIGLNGAVLTLVNAALFKGYPLVRDNHRIAQRSTTRGAIFYPDFLEWRARSWQFADIALTRGSFHTVAMPDRQVETVFAAELTANMFPSTQTLWMPLIPTPAAMRRETASDARRPYTYCA
jgi:hypothetical protein